jgi:hypothetical protein
MYTGDPLNNPIDALRLQVGDTDNEEIWLTDNDYSYYISVHPANVRQQALAASQAILFKLSRRTRERAGQIEVYAGDAYRNYADALIMMVKDPAFSSVNPLSYFGGMYIQDVIDNNLDVDTIPAVFYRGQNTPDRCIREDFSCQDQ